MACIGSERVVQHGFGLSLTIVLLQLREELASALPSCSHIVGRRRRRKTSTTNRAGPRAVSSRRAPSTPSHCPRGRPDAHARWRCLRQRDRYGRGPNRLDAGSMHAHERGWDGCHGCPTANARQAPRVRRQVQVPSLRQRWIEAGQMRREQQANRLRSPSRRVPYPSPRGSAVRLPGCDLDCRPVAPLRVRRTIRTS